MSGWGVGWLLPELDVAELNCAHLLGLSCHPVAICSDAGQHWGGSDNPQRGSLQGGLLINFQHRSVQDRTSTSFSFPPFEGQHQNSNPAVTILILKMGLF